MERVYFDILLKENDMSNVLNRINRIENKSIEYNKVLERSNNIIDRLEKLERSPHTHVYQDDLEKRIVNLEENLNLQSQQIHNVKSLEKRILNLEESLDLHSQQTYTAKLGNSLEKRILTLEESSYLQAEHVENTLKSITKAFSKNTIEKRITGLEESSSLQTQQISNIESMIKATKKLLEDAITESNTKPMKCQHKYEYYESGKRIVNKCNECIKFEKSSSMSEKIRKYPSTLNCNCETVNITILKCALCNETLTIFNNKLSKKNTDL